MCGICGVIQLSGEPRVPVDPEILDRMTDVMTHRGPDDRGTHTDAGVALGVRRLSIVDVEGGHQPVCDENGVVWAAQNGELYNHGELRAQLQNQGHRFRSRCDTEVIPHLYERYGVAFPEHLRGKFGIALWDARNRRAVLARDRLGVKPLYYAISGDLLVFASELKSVLASGLIDGKLDYEAIDAYLTFGFVPGPRTPLAAVSKLPPGHRVVVDSKGVRLERYWAYPQPEPDSRALSSHEYAEGLMHELEESVRLRLMSDVPLGAMLSGGLDSSLVVALMARNSVEPVKTFSIAFREDPEFNELGDARRVAGIFATDHHELELSVGETNVSLSDLIWYLDEPMADLSALGFLALSELASRYVTVALSGQGADELLGGYRKHRAASIIGALQRTPLGAARVAAAIAARGPARSSRAVRALAAPEPVARLLAMSGQLDSPLRARLLRGELATLDGGASARVVSSLLNGVPDEPLSTTLYLDAQLALVDDMLHYFDRASMAHSLEVRVPYLDHHLVEFCARIPDRLKVRRLQTKYLLKHAARGLLPDEIVDKSKIGFFRGSSSSWLRAQLSREFSRYLNAPAPRSAEFLDWPTVQDLVDRHRRGKSSSPQLLLSIAMLEVWLSSYLPRALALAKEPRHRVEARS